MRAYLTTLVAVSLLGNLASLHIEHSREPVNNEALMRTIAGVPVYHFSEDSRKVQRYIAEIKNTPGAEEACNNNPNCNYIGKIGEDQYATFTVNSDAEINDYIKNMSDFLVQMEEDMEVYAQDAEQDFSKYLMDETAWEGAATWGLNAINKDSASATGHGVHAYVYDTGVRTTHSQFQGRAIPTLDAVTGQLIVCSCQNTSCAADRHGHGTHCAGTVGGKDYGVATDARIHAVKVLSDSGSGYTSWQVMCHNWIALNANKPAVLSMSLGGSGNSQTSKNAIDAVVAAGITVVVAAGNSNADACGYSPAFIPSVITVGSTTSTNAMSYFSNYGTCLDIWGPGSSVVSCSHTSDSGTTSKSGTSMACPHVAGAVALLQEMDRHITPAQVISGLLNAAVTGTISGIPSSPASPDDFLQVNNLVVPR